MAKLARVDRIVGQEPLADALKLPAPPTWVGVSPAQRRSRRRLARPLRRATREATPPKRGVGCLAIGGTPGSRDMSPRLSSR